MGTAKPAKQELVLSGGFGTSVNSVRSGYLPIPIERVPLKAFEDIGIYVKTADRPGKHETFTLFRGPTIQFTDEHRHRLLGAGIKLIYIPTADQARFQQQTELCLTDVAVDQTLAASVRAEIVYETSVELVNEILQDPNLAAQAPRLLQVARAVVMLVLDDPKAFKHLFEASHHDFYTATHMVNVGTWMTPLAYALGNEDREELARICQAGMLHDIGKTAVPAEILNKRGKLTAGEWMQIRAHPQTGFDQLASCSQIDPLVSVVTLEHHERLDGSGYPQKLRGDQIHIASRICAVVDSFDAMTACRPFKVHTQTVTQAMAAIGRETPACYDAAVVKAWRKLLVEADKLASADDETASAARPRRAMERFRTNCSARVHPIQQAGQEWREQSGEKAVVHNVSRTGVGFLSQKPLRPGQMARVYILGSSTLRQTNDGMVVRCREYRDGWFEIGLKFSDPT